MNLNFVNPPAHVGERELWELWGVGPTSYSQVTGDPLLVGGSQYVGVPDSGILTQSGNYQLRAFPSVTNSLRPSWAFRWYYNEANGSMVSAGTPLSLGPISAAATTSAMTANGVGTVVVANSLVPGNFVLLTGGATAKSIFMNGQIVQVVTASSTQFTYNYGPAKALNYVSAADTGLKFQLIQASTGNTLGLGTGTGQVATVTAVAVASQVLTVTADNTFSVGQFVVLQGLAAGEVPQGIIAHILTASTTGFTAVCQAPDLSATTGETGTATLLVTNGNIPVTVGPPAAISGTTVAATAASSSAAGAITVLPVSQNFIPGNLMVVEGLTHGLAMDGQIYPVLAASLGGGNVTANAFIKASITTGTADIGVASLLVTGKNAGYPEVQPGTNLSAEKVQFSAIGGLL